MFKSCEKVNMAKCPSCDNKVKLGQKPRIGLRIICPECEAVLDILRLNPPLLDWAFENGEDYYDGGDYLYAEIELEKRYLGN